MSEDIKNSLVLLPPPPSNKHSTIKPILKCVTVILALIFFGAVAWGVVYSHLDGVTGGFNSTKVLSNDARHRKSEIDEYQRELDIKRQLKDERRIREATSAEDRHR
jgi:hypothetical protein